MEGGGETKCGCISCNIIPYTENSGDVNVNFVVIVSGA